MAIQSIGSGGIQESVRRVAGLRKQGRKNKVGASLQKKGSIIKIHVHKKLLSGAAAINKGSKINVFI